MEPSSKTSGAAARFNPLVTRLREVWARHPLGVAIAVAVALRLVAAILSRGFAFHDDHFEVVEVAQRWLDGSRDGLGHPGSWRSLVYPGLHWLVLGGLRTAGVTNPQVEMLVVRLLHAAWSLLAVVYGFRLALAIGGLDRARVAGLLVAAFWFAPFASVRDLAEVVCQPPLLAGLWLSVRAPGEQRPRDLFLAGLWFGLAFALRFQTAIVPLVLGIVLLAERRPKEALALAVGAVLSSVILQGMTDWIGYGRPFSSVLSYIAFNRDPANIARFPRGPWHQYLGTLSGLLIPPTSLLLLWGFLRASRSAPRAFWPTLAFLVLHSAYPGKQERFLLPVLPLVLVLGAVEAQALVERWGKSPWRLRVVRGLWGWFWAVNLVLLVLFTTDDSKRTRIEPLSFVQQQGDAKAVLVDVGPRGPPYVPRFYLGRPIPVYVLAGDDETVAAAIGDGPRPDYLVVQGNERLDERLARLRASFHTLSLVATFEPGLLDRILTRLNPRYVVNVPARLFHAG